MIEIIKAIRCSIIPFKWTSLFGLGEIRGPDLMKNVYPIVEEPEHERTVINDVIHVPIQCL